MKILISESQHRLIIESQSKITPHMLCNSLEEGASACIRMTKILKDGRTKAKKDITTTSIKDDSIKTPIPYINTGTYLSMSIEFFKKVIRGLSGGNISQKNMEGMDIDFIDRLNEMERFSNQMAKDCEKIKDLVDHDMAKLKRRSYEKTPLTMVLENGAYSLLNRLDTHYTAKAYILTRYLIETGKITNESDDTTIRAELKSLFNDDSSVAIIRSFLTETIEMEKEKATPGIMSSLEFSKKRGDAVEEIVFEKLKTIYGKENVIKYSRDFGFIDYFGVDGVVIDKEGIAHPIQISSSPKSNSKILGYKTESCRPFTYYVDRGKVIDYSVL